MTTTPEKILFIINPISGSTSKAALPKLIETKLNSKWYRPEIVFTDYAGQGKEIALNAVHSGMKKIIAVGGDGTINEIAQTLIGTPGVLGIIPAGSGNGLARHLGIPMDQQKAIELLNNHREICIDCATINGKYFFCTAGVGFDAHIGDVFAKKTHRGIKGYITSSIREFIAYSPERYQLIINGETLERTAFLITFANAAQYGNNAFISPEASIQDGLLDVCILKPFNSLTSLGIALRLFTKEINKSKYMEIIRCNSLIVRREKPAVAHADGEPIEMGMEIDVKITKDCLQVIVANK
ncbi:MAG TPA: diacylglycerol kinase family protein [Cytophagaceae bacterium]|jgi:YegS/Rv2252/BmrU family lipid kinase